MGGVKIIRGSNIYYYSFIITFLLQHTTPGQMKWVFFQNFFRKCECIMSCCLPISSNLFKKSLRKTSFFVLLELLPYLQVCLNIMNVYPLQPGVAFLYPLKHQKNFRFSVFRRYRKATPTCNGFMKKMVKLV